MGAAILLAQCACMFVASFVCGSIPLMFKSAASGKRLKAISVLGMGLLVGAALTIIIPEGVSTVFESLPSGGEQHEESTTRSMGLALLSGFALMLLIESLMPHPPHSPPPSSASSPESPSTPLRPTSMDLGSNETIRPYPQHMDSTTPIIPKKRMHMRDGQDDGHGGGSSGAAAIHGLNATLGLVIHGAADGIALGASSLSGRSSLGLVVFLAVLVHKGPTALGLTTTLLSFNLSHPMIRRRLLIFSFAAPLGAVVTYLAVKAFGWGSQSLGSAAGGGVDHLTWWTGIALLFSGGSFLYVATVIQPLSNDSHSHKHHHQHEGQEQEPDLGKYARVACLIIGMILPVMLSWLVGDHGH